MGLIEDIQFKDDSRRAIGKMLEIDKKSFFNKRVSLDYKVFSDQQKLFFECLNHKYYSFYTHDLELGEKEALHWHAAAQGGETALFNGRANRFYDLNFGCLRGFIETLNDNHLTGLVVKGKRVQTVLTEDDFILYQANLISMQNQIYTKSK